MKPLFSIALLAALVIASQAAQAANAQAASAAPAAPVAASPASTLKITDAYLYMPTAGSDTVAIYMTITNDGTADDKLLKAGIIGNSNSEIDDVKVDKKGVQTMVKLDSLPVPAKKTVKLEPGHVHVVLKGMVGAIQAGMKVPLIMTFEKAGSVMSTVEIKAPEEKPKKEEKAKK